MAARKRGASPSGLFRWRDVREIPNSTHGIAIFGNTADGAGDDFAGFTDEELDKEHAITVSKQDRMGAIAVDGADVDSVAMVDEKEEPTSLIRAATCSIPSRSRPTR